jgi:hypothetical protein
MLDAVYVDTVEEKAIVAIRPKPAFWALFEVATTREGSGGGFDKRAASGSSESGGG